MQKIIIINIHKIEFPDTSNAHIVGGASAHNDDGVAATRAHQNLPVGVLCDTAREGLPRDASNFVEVESTW